MGIQYIKASNGKTYPVDSSLSDEEAIEYVIKQIKGPESKENPVKANERIENLAKNQIQNLLKAHKGMGLNILEIRKGIKLLISFMMYLET